MVNVHVRDVRSPQYEAALLLRDWLRARPAERDEYAAHKRDLAARTSTTKAYAAAKDPWFDEVYPRARAWAAASGWSAGP
ncbi:MAG: GrpB family protein [Dermatophilaceae bacterium]